ncbi:nucleoside recognition domain-containing protein [Peptococcaceae bacterium 1198_IL3148]
MDILAFLKQALLGSLEQVWIMAVIIFPLMLILEIAKDLNILDKLGAILYPLLKLFNISNHGGIPLMAGLVFGINYGAGVIIDAAKSGALDAREVYLVNIFLVVCHSIFEDTALFMVYGANGALIVLSRLIMAIVITYLFSRWKRLTVVTATTNSSTQY